MLASASGPGWLETVGCEKDQKEWPGIPETGLPSPPYYLLRGTDQPFPSLSFPCCETQGWPGSPPQGTRAEPENGLRLRLPQPQAPNGNLFPSSLPPPSASCKSPDIISQNHILNTVLIKHQSQGREDMALLSSAEPPGATGS